MAHGYRILQHWNKWLHQQYLGKTLMEAEKRHLSTLLGKHFGKHALLIGVSHQSGLLDATKIPCHSLISPLMTKEPVSGFIEGDFHELPILTGSIDLVMLPHTLEYIDNPRQLLSEACRIIKPEGLIVITGFNPYSAWGLTRMLTRHKDSIPWSANFIQSAKVKGWLELADFEMEKQKSILHIPPVNSPRLHKKLHFLDDLGSKYLSILGGVYIIIARAKVIPLTPIRLKWKQQLKDIRISTTISGHIARQSK